MNKQPFKRSLAMMAAISSIMQLTDKSFIQSALVALGEYKSRGHGKGKLGKSIGYTTNWKARLHGQTNGKRECTRRVKQMANLAN